MHDRSTTLHASHSSRRADILTRLDPGDRAIVREVRANPVDQARLMGLGICAGRAVLLLKSGDPTILQVYGSRIGLSARLGRLIVVDPLPDAADGAMADAPAASRAPLFAEP
jgi:Fe2+ transport system protein FeoA